MKKSLLILILALAVLAAGCASGNLETTQSSTAVTTLGTTAAGDTETTAPETTAPENTETDPTETQPEQTDPVDEDGEDGYLNLLKEQSDILKTSLQEDELTQAELNQKSQDLYKLWDDALNDLWGKLRSSLPEDEFDKLLDEQLDWIEDKENAVAEAGKPYEGGSIYPLIVNSEAAQITEDRVYELYELLK